MSWDYPPDVDAILQSAVEDYDYAGTGCGPYNCSIVAGSGNKNALSGDTPEAAVDAIIAAHAMSTPPDISLNVHTYKPSGSVGEGVDITLHPDGTFEVA